MLRLIGQHWADTVFLTVIVDVAGIASVAFTRYSARQRGLSEREYRRLHRGILFGAVPDDLADHAAVGPEIAAAHRGAIGES